MISQGCDSGEFASDRPLKHVAKRSVYDSSCSLVEEIVGVADEGNIEVANNWRVWNEVRILRKPRAYLSL